MDKLIRYIPPNVLRVSAIPSLFELLLKFIEINIDKIKKRELPANIAQAILERMLQRRKAGSRALKDDNVAWLFVPGSRELNLETFWMTDKPFFSFNCPALEVLNLTGCLQVGDSAMHWISSSSRNLRVLCADMCNRITDDGCSSIATLNKLQVLTLKANKITDKGIIQIAHSCTDLKSLTLTMASALTLGSFVPVATTLSELVELVVTEVKFSDADWDTLTSLGFANLIKFSISNSLNVNSLPVHLKKLQILEVAHCPLTSTEHIAKLSSLTSLKLFFCEKLKDVLSVSAIASNLTELNLTGCKRIEHKLLSPLMLNIGLLQKLLLQGCQKISSFELAIMQTVKLNELHMSWCENEPQIPLSNFFCGYLTHICLEGPGVKNTTIANIGLLCPNLVHLSLKECHYLRNNIADIIAQCFPKLEFLELIKCMRLSDIIVSLPNVTKLYISWSSITSLTFNCPNLETLDVSGCLMLACESLIPSLQFSGPNLSQLWLRKTDCNDNVLDAVTKYCHKIRIINLADVHYISSLKILELAERCFYLERIYLNGCNFASIQELAMLSSVLEKCFQISVTISAPTTASTTSPTTE